MQKACESCGTAFETSTRSRKYCGERCKKRAQRKPGGTVVSLPTQPSAPTSDGVLTAATRDRLVTAGRDRSELGAATLMLAARLDAVSIIETGSGVAALMKEYRATLAEAVKDADAADNPLEDIRRSAALKLITNIA